MTYVAYLPPVVVPAGFVLSLSHPNYYLDFSGSGFDCPMDKLHINMLTARTAARRAPLRRVARTLYPRRSRGRCYPIITYVSIETCVRHLRTSHSTYSKRKPMAVPPMLQLAVPPTRQECIVYCLSSILANRPQMSLEIGGHLSRRRRQFSFILAF